jgi:hypothetical protein
MTDAHSDGEEDDPPAESLNGTLRYPDPEVASEGVVDPYPWCAPR